MKATKVEMDFVQLEQAEAKVSKIQQLVEDLKDLEDLINQNTHYLDKLNDDLFDMKDGKEELFAKIENIIELLAVLKTAEEMDIDIKKMIMNS